MIYLPNELILTIFDLLDKTSRFSISWCCTKFRDPTILCNDCVTLACQEENFKIAAWSLFNGCSYARLKNNDKIISLEKSMKLCEEVTRYNDYELMNRLLGKNYVFGKKCYKIACRLGNLDILTLLNFCSNQQNYAKLDNDLVKELIQISFDMEHIEILEWLYAHHPQNKCWAELTKSLGKGHYNSYCCLFSKMRHIDFFKVVIDYGRTDLLSYLIKLHPDYNKEIVLELARIKGSREILALLE